MRQDDVLILDQDDALGTELRIFLSRSCGWQVRVVAAPQELLAAAQEGGLRLVLVGDGACGPDTIRQLRRRGFDGVVIFLDRQSRPDIGADAFAAGADDVARLPFSIREFGLRLRARLGDAMPLRPEAAVPRVMLDGDSRLISADSRETVQLTPSEAEVMAVLIRRGGEIVTRDALSQAIDNCAWVYGDRKFDVHITKIRRKLRTAFGERYVVRTVRSEGYAFYESAPASAGRSG
ncbi:response regulator transcription factor [Acidimangrovimonas pyrenivorans]|uniref:Response regulator transcription factor n=1 Tax=Acidimangrovimonas pyrenivorans TaxID=2030798 RepID=A0ABV7ANA7_9RHOB